MDGNLEVSVFQVEGEHHIYLPDDSQDLRHCLHPECGELNILVQVQKILFTSPKVPEPLQTLSCKKGIFKVPTTQAGGSGMGLDTQTEGHPLSKPVL